MEAEEPSRAQVEGRCGNTVRMGLPPWGPRGFIHLYTGDGKGKSTAAFGLALRALARGAKVWILQLVKSEAYAECALEALFPGTLTIQQCGLGCTFNREITPQDQRAAKQALLHARELLTAHSVDMLILDELCVAIALKMVTQGQVESVLRARQPYQELILTGRYAPDWLIAACDLVTRMEEVKHYYQQGVLARPGIER